MSHLFLSNLLPFVIVVVAAAGVVAVIGIVLYLADHYIRRGLLAPERKVRARVLRKMQEGRYVDEADSTWGVSEVMDYSYFVVFGADGHQLEFAVSEETFANLHEGDEGVLAHKGTIFKYFLPLVPPPSGTTR